MTDTARNILVVGATSAIAAATARLYATEGARFFLVARQGDKLAAVAQDLAARGAVAVGTMEADLTDPIAISKILPAVRLALPGIDLALIAHGQLGDDKNLRDDPDAAAAVIFLNFTSVAMILTPLAGYMEIARRGTIAVIGSVAGDRGRQSNYVYGASKAGLACFLSGLRNRLAKAKVHVMTIKPGFVATPMTAHLKQNALFVSPEQIARTIAQGVAKGSDVIYAPGYWRLIMIIIRALPESLFKRLNL